MPRWNVNFDVKVNTESASLRNSLARVSATARLSREIPLPPGADRRLNSMNIMRAVRGTTGLEGADLTEQEVADIIASESEQILPEIRGREEHEARNANRVMEYVANNAGEQLTEAHIRNIHRVTTEGIDYTDNIPGVYRSHQNRALTYLPPETNEEIRQLMTEFISWINSGERLSWDPVIRAVVSHFYVVSIHPFGDGNGRTSRGVESFILFGSGINVRGFYSLANFYYRNREEYVRLLDHVRFETQGDLTPFVQFAVTGLEAELELVHQEIVDELRWIAFRDFYREQIFSPDGPQ
ncbi:MAG: Fic family protein, partial [Dehalococcoidia bacterium]